MDTPGAAEAAGLLRDFRYVDPFWSGTAFVPFWRAELVVNVYPDDDGITARQLAVLRAVLDYPDDLRPRFERALYRYYKADVEGSHAAYDPAAGGWVPGSGPPVLTKSDQVWPLIDGPEVFIHPHFETRSAVEFELSFTCDWDPEHGLGVTVRNWRPVEFGGWGG